MWCCAWGKRLFLCRVVVVLWPGRCGGLTRKVGNLPTLRGGPQRSRHTSHTDCPPGHPCRESPGLFVLSLSHSLECSRQCVHLLARLRGSRRVGCKPPQARLHALLNACAAGESTTAGSLKAASLNASAASESTTAGGLEALSKLRWSREV